jgi:alpha-L-rhamnosidase
LENKLKWIGKWIWLPDRPPTELNIYARFEKAFELDEVPERAIADISADSRYMLYVNGSFVCRGVPMCDPLYQYYDQASARVMMDGVDTAAYVTRDGAVEFTQIGPGRYEISVTR